MTTPYSHPSGSTRSVNDLWPNKLRDAKTRYRNDLAKMREPGQIGDPNYLLRMRDQPLEDRLRTASVMSVPIASDIAGLAADAMMYKRDPSSRTVGNALLSGLGALPFVPNILAVRAFQGSRSADDLSRVDFPALEQPKDLTRASSSTKGNVVGAPDHIRVPADEDIAVENYLRYVEYGAPAANWYRDESARILRMSGGRPGVADRAAGSLGVTSANTALEANNVGGLRGYNQAVTGRAVNTHMGANDRKIESIHAGLVDKLGPKISPYVNHLRGAWEPPPQRAVHDVWDMRAWGYNTDKGVPGEAQHRWMDKAASEAVARANARKLGGRSDWTHEEVQAAAWTALKSEELGVTPDVLANGYAQFAPKTTATLSVETALSKELIRPNVADPAALHTALENAVTTPMGQDLLLEQAGGLSMGPKELSTGIWGAERNPVTRIPVAASVGQGTNRIDPASQEVVEFVGSLHGLLKGQADVGYDMLRPAKRVGDINAYAFDLGRSPKATDIQRARDSAAEAMGISPESVMVTANGNRLNVTVLPDDSGKMPVDGKMIKQAATALDRGAEMMENSGALITWQSAYKPSAYLEKLQNPAMRERVDSMLPQVASRIEAVLKQTRGKWDPIYTKTLEAIRTGGLAEVERLVKAGILPAAVLAVIVAQATGETPENPEGI